MSGEVPADGAVGTVVAVSSHPYRWAMFGAMCAVYVTFGMLLLAIPPMIDDVRAELGASRGALGFALGAWSLLYIVTAPPAGRVIDRIGVRRAVTIGSLLIAVSAAVQAAAPNLAVLWLATAVIGLGGPLVSLSAPKLVTLWFANPDERPAAVGYYTSAPALGGVVSLALTNSVLLPAFGDWRSVLAFDAVLCVASAVVWIVVSGKAPSRTLIPDAAPGPRVRWRPAAAALMASDGVRLAMALGAGAFFLTQGLAAWLPDILEAHSGLSARAAANWSAVSLAVGMVGRFVLPGRATPARRSPLMQGLMAVLAAAMLALAIGPPAVDVVAAVLLGLRSVLNALVVVVLMDADGVTAANVGMAYGLWFSAVEVGGALGPLVIGALGDSGVGFPGALVAMAALVLAMMATLLHNDRRRRLP